MELNWNEVLHSPADLTLEHVRAIVKSFEQDYGEDWELDVQEHHLKEVFEVVSGDLEARYDAEDFADGTVSLWVVRDFMVDFPSIVERTSLREQVPTVRLIVSSPSELVLSIA